MCGEQEKSGISIDKVQEIIEQVAEDFKKDEKIILTEHDLQWRICHYLQQNKDIKREGCSDNECWDPDDEYTIHTEINWNKLKDKYEGLKQANTQLLKGEKIIKKRCKPDISLVHRDDLHVQAVKNTKENRYNFDINNRIILMELKFIDEFRTSRTLGKYINNKIQKDINKIRHIKLLNKMFNKSNIYFFMVIFYTQPKNDMVEQNVLDHIKKELEDVLYDDYCTVFGSL